MKVKDLLKELADLVAFDPTWADAEVIAGADMRYPHSINGVLQGEYTDKRAFCTVNGFGDEITDCNAAYLRLDI